MATANIAQTKIVPVETQLTPYYDDFSEDKNFHRILFRPGYAVQARELTQLQTILQNQVERFGNHIFKNGSLVLGGQISLDTGASHINLQTSYANTDIVAQRFQSNTVTYLSGNAKVRAVVLGTREKTDTDPPVLVVKYLTGDEFAASDSITSNNFTANANVAISNPTGPATLASINDGIFYINGYFVKVPAQTVVVDKFTAFANAKVGLEYTDEIITELEDTSLLDPAQEASNYQAPGASRLRINFDLAVRSLTSIDDEKFVELLRVENGEIKKQIQYPIYSVIGDTLARRTFDESGNYTVRRFNLNLNADSGNTQQLQLTLDPGKAYIKGYEYESIAKTALGLRKARTTANATGRDLTISFGNYLYVQNVTNSFNTSAMMMVDLHSVPNAFVTRSTTNAAYAATRVGTARLRELKLYTASNTSDTNTYSYTMSLFDTKFANLTTNAVTSTANTITLYDNGTISANDNAYTNSTIRITSGAGLGESYEILSYNGLNKIVTVSSNWVTLPTAASNVSLDLQIHSVKSIVAHTYHTQAPGNASANIAMSSKDTTGKTSFSEPEKNMLVYRWGDSFIKAGSMAGTQNYQYVRYYADVTTSANQAQITIQSDETFVGTADSTGQSALTLSSFMVFRRDTGARVRLSAVSISGSPPTATLSLVDVAAGIRVSVYARVNKDPANVNVVQKTKTLYIGNTTHKQATTTSIPCSANFGTALVADSGSANGQIVITNPSRQPRERMCLYVADVKKITKIYDLAGAAVPTTGSSLVGYNDVTNSYTFDNGQRDSHYDFGYISLKPAAGTITGPLIVCYDYYDHTSGTGDGLGYFSVDSYTSPESYEEIPSYTSSTGEVIPLRDAIDFRPKRGNWSNTTPNYSFSGIRIPYSDTSFEASYQYYLPRRDLVALSTNFEKPFSIIEGLPAKNPMEPPIDDNTMILYKLYIEPYTLGVNNVAIQYVENKRYTMRDIGRLETRIENLEYYQTLSILEKAADSMKILDANGLERTKYGIIADDFKTHAYGDVNNADYFVSIDTDIGGMEPAQNPQALPIYVASQSSTKTLGPATTLDFTETLFVSQNVATKFVPVQPYMLSQWVGTIKMDPPDGNWVEVEKTPDVILNLTGQNDALLANNTTKSNNRLSTQSSAWSRHFGRRRRR